MEDKILTEEVKRPLLEMVRFQQEKGESVRFTTPLGALNVRYQDEFFVSVPVHALEAWQSEKYVFITPGEAYREVPPDEEAPEDEGPHYSSYEALLITLTQKALDYYTWLQKPKWKRLLIQQVKEASSEIRAAVISIVAAVITSILTVYILHLLGFS